MVSARFSLPALATLVALVALVALALPRTARADDTAQPAVAVARPVRFHHAPIGAADEGRALVLDAGLDDPHLASALILVHRGVDGVVHETPFQRAASGYRAVIPAARVRGALAYAVEVTTLDGTRVAAFASRDAMHPVQLLADRTEEREAALLARASGRRSVVSVSTELADFGSTDTARGSVRDAFWKIEGRYVYRPLRTVAELGIRGGVLRGAAPQTDEVSGALTEREVGLNYGAPGVRLRLHELWHLELEGMASISDEGFSTGGGTTLLVGDPYGSKLVVGAAFVGLSDASYFGSRFFSRVDLAAHERVTVSPVVEVTDMPHAERFGVRLLADVAVVLGGGFSANLSGGYQARRAASGGPALGAGAQLAF